MALRSQPRPTRSSAPPAPGAWGLVPALRMLAAPRLTEAQLWTRLERKGHAEEAIRDALEFARRHGYLDDALFATLYVEGKRKAVGDARLVADLVKRGIGREAARDTVAQAECGEAGRLARGRELIIRRRPAISYPSAAQAHERLGFPTPLIYRHLREHAATLPDLDDGLESAD